MDVRKWRLLTCDIAEHVQWVWLERFPDDNRPQRAIDVARRHINGQASDDELSAAGTAAEASAWYATAYAAGCGAEAAAWAARDSAWYAGDVARDATKTASVAASVAASAAARDGAGYAAGYAEREWQDERLLEYVRGER